MFGIIWWMVYKPRTRGNLRPQLPTLSRRRLLTSGTIGIPDTTFTGRRIMPLWNIQFGITMLVKVGVLVTALLILAGWGMLFPLS
ncbi:MAG: hypothetical protein K9N21_16195 [Deltaproteobacteria bacterium]|nr:hypothetical protein [Deltaproteobacteria bacterium]